MQLAFSLLMVIFHPGSTGELGTPSQNEVLDNYFATCITEKTKCETKVLFLEGLTGNGVDEKLQSFRIVKHMLNIILYSLVNNIFHQY